MGPEVGGAFTRGGHGDTPGGCMGARNRRWAAIAGFGFSTVFVVSTAAAEEPAAPPYFVSLRGTGGIGAGSIFGPRGEVSGEVWLNEFVGVGGFFGASSPLVDASSQVDFTLPSTTSQSSTTPPSSRSWQSVTFAGGSLAMRTAGRGSYGYVSFGAGSAWGQTKYARNCPIVMVVSVVPACTAPAPPPTSFEGAMVDMTLAWLWHPWGLELGPSFSVDLMNGGVQGSLSVAVGFAMDAPPATPK